ncbi:hypothetical protein [Chryseobacterium sp. Leaf180]|uniref:hypothetical protein n=1 Tax=Chryseobacterium sp. Leaf180 TaxID=1736289 RepID=UPI000A9F0023|nr:hypothetical protein [Chryseobacterium sp. Leaf180]
MFSLFKTTKKLKISDDSGFLAIVNSDTYKSFVDEDWQLNQLMQHFIDEMNNKNIIFWATGNQSNWTVSFVDKPDNKKAFREFTSTITVTDEKLYLTNYDDLTMSAQFEDTKIPAKHNSDLIIKLENGLYNLTILQLFDPEDYDYEADGKTNFEIVMQRTEKETEKINKIYWWTE